MDTPEAKVKDEVKRILNRYGVYYFMPVSTGYGVKGAPDFIACVEGRFLGIECKANLGQLTKLQEQVMLKIKDSGGSYMVFRENSSRELISFLESVSVVKYNLEEENKEKELP